MTFDPYLAVAAALCAVWMGIHVFAGGAEIARPLLRARELASDKTLVLYFCWHMVSIVIGASALGLAFAAMEPGARSLAIFLGGLNGAFAVLGIVLVPVFGERYVRVPQGWLFLPVAGLVLWSQL